MRLLNAKQMPIIKKVLTPFQFFNKLPVDIKGQNSISSVEKDMRLYLLKLFIIILK